MQIHNKRKRREERRDEKGQRIKDKGQMADNRQFQRTTFQSHIPNECSPFQFPV